MYRRFEHVVMLDDRGGAEDRVLADAGMRADDRAGGDDDVFADAGAGGDPGQRVDGGIEIHARITQPVRDPLAGPVVADRDNHVLDTLPAQAGDLIEAPEHFEAVVAGPVAARVGIKEPDHIAVAPLAQDVEHDTAEAAGSVDQHRVHDAGLSAGFIGRLARQVQAGPPGPAADKMSQPPCRGTRRGRVMDSHEQTKPRTITAASRIGGRVVVLLLPVVLLAAARQSAAPPPTSAPASRPAVGPRVPPQVELLRPLLRRQARPMPILPRSSESGAQREKSEAEARLLAEGTLLVERPGEFARVNGVPTFRFADAPELPAMQILPNSWLEAMEELADNGFKRFLISAEVTRYRGKNYLLLVKFRRQASHGNVGP